MIICDSGSTIELKVGTVSYFTSVGNANLEPIEL